jgi:hypothetical protein
MSKNIKYKYTTINCKIQGNNLGTLLKAGKIYITDEQRR